MESRVKTLGAATLISFVLVLPFAFLEARNNIVTRQNAPGLLVLFGLLWLLPTAFIFVLAPMAQTVRAGHSLLAAPLKLLFRVAFLTLTATMWSSLLFDQLPCFLGYPNCD